MGNTVVWKPASTAAYSRALPDEAVRGGRPAARRDQPRLRLRRRRSAIPRSRAPTSPASTSPARPRSSTGCGAASRATSSNYRNYPRIVGETGGKDFIVAHPSADVDALATAIVRGSFEYQGQKCSAASRVFAPSNLWPELKERLVEQVRALKIGNVNDFGNFMGAVIDGTRSRRRRRRSTRRTRPAARRACSSAAATTTRTAGSSSRR